MTHDTLESEVVNGGLKYTDHCTHSA